MFRPITYLDWLQLHCPIALFHGVYLLEGRGILQSTIPDLSSSWTVTT